MSRFLIFLFRLVVIAAGFIVGCLAAAIVEVILNGIVTPGEMARLTERGVDLALIIGLLGLSSLIAHAAFLPFAVLILFAEFSRQRSWLFFTLGGGLIAGALIGIAASMRPDIPHDPFRVSVDIVAGMLGGIAYWLVAGRRSGHWLPSELDKENRRRSGAL